MSEDVSDYTDEDRKRLVGEVRALKEKGVSVQKACSELGLSYSNYYAWQHRYFEGVSNGVASYKKYGDAQFEQVEKLLEEGLRLGEALKKVGINPHSGSAYTWWKKRKEGFQPRRPKKTTALVPKEENKPQMHTFHFTDGFPAAKENAEETPSTEAPMVLLVGRGEQINKALDLLSGIWGIKR